MINTFIFTLILPPLAMPEHITAHPKLYIQVKGPKTRLLLMFIDMRP